MVKHILPLPEQEQKGDEEHHYDHSFIDMLRLSTDIAKEVLCMLSAEFSRSFGDVFR